MRRVSLPPFTRSTATRVAVAVAALFAASGAEASSPKPDGSGAASVTVLPHRGSPTKDAIGLTPSDVAPHRFARRIAPEGAPNVVVVLLDDVGFGAASTFGGAIETPHLDALAREGLRYNRFHTTAICSPTRAALLTGRNAHAAGVGSVLNSPRPYRGTAGVLRRETATIAEVLRLHGYGTAAFGKWHLTPDHEAGPTGPFDRWPTGVGFERFYGFLGGETHQFEPTLFEGTRPVMRPPGGDYHITADLADRAIDWVQLQNALHPERPFFLYIAPGATHAPLHAPKEWIERYAGRFDAGWDALRETTFERQKKLGVVPKDAKLTSRPKELRAWQSLDADERRVAARLMEVYAGFLAHTDAQLGRVFEALREVDVFDDTLVFYVVGDNGGSGEGGGDHGTWNEMGRIQGIVQTPQELLTRLDAMGGTTSYPHYSAGWAWATNAPFQWVKQVASHFGGSRNPLVVSWPNGIRGEGGVRSQFAHVNDVVPTILEAAGIAAPAQMHGVAQEPMDGTSLVYTFDDEDAAERHETQYFEVNGNRAIYHRGWIAASRNRARAPWESLTSRDIASLPEVWELYDLTNDFSQADDLASRQPEKLARLRDLFYAEAGRNRVLPISSSPAGESPFPALGEGRDEVSYTASAVGLHESAVPDLKNRSHRVIANIEVDRAGGRGVLATQGGVVAGWALYLTKDGRPAYVYNLFGKTVTTIAGDDALSPGEHRVEMRFTYDGGGRGRGAEISLRVDGGEVARGRIERSAPVFFSIDETFDVGIDTGSPCGDYPPGFAFNGRIERVVLRARP